MDKSRGKPKDILLAFKEIKKIEDLINLTALHVLVRDRFLYSCYTGLRISDNIALRKDVITDGKDGLIVRIHDIKGEEHTLIHPLRLLFDGKPEIVARKWISRHTCATMLAEITQNPFLMLQIMGWYDVRIAMNYIHNSEKSTKRQLQVLEGKWGYG